MCDKIYGGLLVTGHSIGVCKFMKAVTHVHKILHSLPVHSCRETTMPFGSGLRVDEPGVRGEEPEGRVEEPGVWVEEPGGRVEEPGVRVEEARGMLWIESMCVWHPSARQSPGIRPRHACQDIDKSDG